MTAATRVIDLQRERELRRGFLDNHGRTWVVCNPGDTGGTIWNLYDGSRVRCRLTYPNEWPTIVPEMPAT